MMNSMMMWHGSSFGLIKTVVVILFIIFLVKIIKKANKSGKNNTDIKNKVEKAPNLTRDKIEHYHESGLSDSDITIFRENMLEAEKNIKSWSVNLAKSDDLQVVESVTAGLDGSKNIFKYIVQNPLEQTKQNEFLYRDLPNMVKLTEKYIEMKNQTVITSDVQRDMDETLLLIKTLSKNIAKNYHELLMDDVKIIKNQVKFD